ncbi:odorant receptor Or1-like [Tribolium madens]|uniref:odorant receptor Or1-like n=1 Tax=Tribolium madens TaxID=41895 RepID=UPI001CF764CC|nr:odorant receptor Or1-like [Tribolium madens]
MESFDWQHSIKPNLNALKLVGLWPKGDFYKLDLYTFYTSLAVVVIVCGHNLSQFVYILQVYSDLKALTATIFVTSINFLGAVKMYFFMKHIKTVKILFKMLKTYQFKPKNIQQTQMVEPFLNLWKILYVGYSINVYLIVVMWSLLPVFNGWTLQKKLPFPARYPFDVTKSPYYELAYVYQFICIWYITIANLNLDTIIIALMMYTSCQCDLLCDNLKNLSQKRLFDKKLIDCIKHHKSILNFAEKSNNLFNMIVLGQIATSTVVLALTMFQLSLVSPLSSEGLNHLFYIGGIIMQILLYCWFGNEVETRSSNVLSAIYESSWFEASQNTKKNLLIFSIRCQRPIKVTALKLFALSLRTFITIVRSGWSYFAVLYNVGSK